MSEQRIAQLRAVFTNEVIRAIGSLARQQNVCREQGGKAVFVTGMEAAREYIVEHISDALSASPAETGCASETSGWRPIYSAPKEHGTRAIINYEAALGNRVTLGIWHSDRMAWWCDVAYVHPTHWMPLPDPPPSASSATTTEQT